MKSFQSKWSPLEAMLLREAYRRYWAYGFPKLEEINLIGRTYTSVGRRVRIEHPKYFDVPDGVISLAQAELGDSGTLVVAELLIASGRIEVLEIFAVGDQAWGGEEPEPIALHTR